MEALAVTARLCGPELERYGRCVAASPGSWQRDCHRLRDSVTRCASDHPLVRRIRRDCSAPLGALERCLRERPGSAAECGPRAADFLLCAETATAAATSATPGATPGATSDTPGATPGATSDTPGATPGATSGATLGATPGGSAGENPWN